MNTKVEYMPPTTILFEITKKQTMKLNNDPIKKAIELVNWNFIFSNQIAHEQVAIFTQTLIFFEL